MLSSIVGDCSIKRSYSARLTVKKSNAGFLILGSRASSTDISRLNLDQLTSATRCPSINSA